MFIYGEELAPGVAAAIKNLLGRYEGVLPAGAHGWSEADAALIAYGDTLLGENPPLKTLAQFLRDPVGERGSFVDFCEVREDLGGCENIGNLSPETYSPVDMICIAR